MFSARTNEGTSVDSSNYLHTQSQDQTKKNRNFRGRLVHQNQQTTPTLIKKDNDNNHNRQSSELIDKDIQTTSPTASLQINSTNDGSPNSTEDIDTNKATIEKAKKVRNGNIIYLMLSSLSTLSIIIVPIIAIVCAALISTQALFLLFIPLILLTVTGFASVNSSIANSDLPFTPVDIAEPFLNKLTDSITFNDYEERINFKNGAKRSLENDTEANDFIEQLNNLKFTGADVDSYGKIDKAKEIAEAFHSHFLNKLSETNNLVKDLDVYTKRQIASLSSERKELYNYFTLLKQKAAERILENNKV